MRYLILLLLLLAAHFSLTPFAPAPSGKAAFYWPFAADSKSWLMAAGLPSQVSAVLTPLLAAIAGLGFLAAALGLFGWIIPANWWLPIVVTASIASALLYGLYFGAWAILPLVLDAGLLWGVFFQQWSVAGLQ